MRSKNFLFFGSFERNLILYSYKIPIIFQIIRNLFLELFLAEPAIKLRYASFNSTASGLGCVGIKDLASGGGVGGGNHQMNHYIVITYVV